jgi:hypothetical protein
MRKKINVDEYPLHTIRKLMAISSFLPSSIFLFIYPCSKKQTKISPHHLTEKSHFCVYLEERKYITFSCSESPFNRENNEMRKKKKLLTSRKNNSPQGTGISFFC